MTPEWRSKRKSLDLELTPSDKLNIKKAIVITVIPKLQHDLGFSATGLSWVQNAYTLAFGGLLLTWS
ncbi:hypothetical protein [Paenibacillus foliorum]|nr:hypothetical protein [Paenibacillus foliorum]